MTFELIYNKETDKDSVEYSTGYNTFLSLHQEEGYFRTELFAPQIRPVYILAWFQTKVKIIFLYEIVKQIL
jgi:hypothetical protein